MQESVKRFLLTIFFFLILFSILSSLCFAENEFDVIRVGNIITYGDNHFKVKAPEDGRLIISVHDDICEYRLMEWNINCGENMLQWDGCGFNREKLYSKIYTISCTFEGQSGAVYTNSFNSPIAFTDQALQYALPSSKILYLDQPDDWFIEFRTVMDGTVILEFDPNNLETERVSYTFSTSGGKINREKFASFKRKRDPAPGMYTVYVYEASKPDDKVAFSLEINKNAPDKTPVFITGEIMPDRSMNEQEIWDLMMRPSVVIDIDFFDHQNVYDKPDKSSRSLGTLHGQTQCLNVIRINNEWAYVGAWNHEEADYVEGWVPLNVLKVTEPQKEYGILVDKQKQTLTLFHQGKILDTLFVSTGRPDEKRLYQETSAGCFLTGYHRVNFSTNGKKYDYVFQYDGGNLLHQTPYQWGHNKKDFKLGRGYLGAKASHACIRIQAEPGINGINAYWLWTHIPYHTRVIILDDPEERKGLVQQLCQNKSTLDPLPDDQITCEIKNTEDTDVVFTFGGNFIPGSNQSFQRRGNSFITFIKEKGVAAPFSELKSLFTSDDFTCISLCSPMEYADDTMSVYSGLKYAPASVSELFTTSSIEGIQLTDNTVYDEKPEIIQQTEDAVRKHAVLISRGEPTTISIKGHLFGMAAFSEQEYLKDPGIIQKSLEVLNEMECERIIALISWGEKKGERHTIIQEAMARRSILAGADLVIGSSSHRVQGIEKMMDVPVIYSMGVLLDGSTSQKPKNQDGILIRSVFHFNDTSRVPDITVIPIEPYGNTSDHNTYTPTTDLFKERSSHLIDKIRKDSYSFSIEKITFYMNRQ